MSQNPVTRAGGKFGLSAKETRDPIGIAVLALNKMAQSPLLDKLKMRKHVETAVFQSTRSGFKVAASASRTFAKKGKKGAPGVKTPAAASKGLFDLTPTEDEQMLAGAKPPHARPDQLARREVEWAPGFLLHGALDGPVARRRLELREVDDGKGEREGGMNALPRHTVHSREGRPERLVSRHEGVEGLRQGADVEEPAASPSVSDLPPASELVSEIEQFLRQQRPE